VTVALTHGAGLMVYLTGEGQDPVAAGAGRQHWTLLCRRFARAGGFLTTANTGYVLLIRNKADGTLAVSRVDVDKILSNESADPYLQRRDVVYVPEERHRAGQPVRRPVH